MKSKVCNLIKYVQDTRPYYTEMINEAIDEFDDLLAEIKGSLMENRRLVAENVLLEEEISRLAKENVRLKADAQELSWWHEFYRYERP